MDFCLGIAGFLEKSISEYVDIAKRTGMNKLEILFGMNREMSPQLYRDMKGDEIKKVKKIFEWSAVKAHALVVPNDFTSAEWKEHLDLAKNAVDTAEFLQTGIIVMYGGSFPQFDRSKDDWNYRRMPAISKALFTQSVDCFQSLIEYTGDRPIRFAIENHDNMTFSGKHFKKFLDAVGSEKIGVAFDPTNFRCLGEDPFVAFNLLKDRIYHFHLKGAHKVDDMVVFDHFMDKDDFDWAKMLKLLKGIYVGVYVIESLFPNIAEEATVKNMEFFNNILGSL